MRVCYDNRQRWEKVGKYFGRYERNLDERNRLQIPSKLFSSLPDRFYAMRGFDGCLAIYEESAFLATQDDLANLSYRNPESRAFIRIALASVSELEVDAHGRITLGKELCDHYSIGQKVVVLGIQDHFEVWDAVAYATYEAKAAKEFESLAAKAEVKA